MSTGLEVAIIGMAGRFPGAKNVEELWRKVRAGECTISFFSNEELERAQVDPALRNDDHYVAARGILEGVEEFDAAFFGFSAREAQITDPQHRLFLECAWEALERAGYDARHFDGDIGVYAGAGANSYALNVFSNPELMRKVGGFQTMVGSDKDFLTTRVSYLFQLTGPSLAVQSACSTSLVAVHLACQGLIAGECHMALAGGVSITVPQASGYLHGDGGIGSPDGYCRAFDARAQGTVSGNGAGVVVLKRLEDAEKDGDTILAVLRGTALNNDGGAKIGYTAPGIEGQARVVRAAQVLAEVEAETITYIEAHGTGTELGDPIEVEALTEAFRVDTEARGFCALGSVKTNLGHLDTAAGVTGLIKTTLALQHRELPPSLHFESPNPQIDFANSPFFVNAELRPWETDGALRRAGVSSFGIGGTNAHVVVEEAPPRPPSSPSREHQLLVLSARTPAALEAATSHLAEHLKGEHLEAGRTETGAPLADVAYTLQVGRRRFDARRVAVVTGVEDAAQVLRDPASERLLGRQTSLERRPVVFLFPGQGSQYPGMTAGLYRQEASFREALDRCAEVLEPELGFDLRPLLFFDGSDGSDGADQEGADQGGAVERLRATAVAQPALFAVEYALACLWREWVGEPAALAGHSIGEWVAACLAGVVSLEDGLRLAALRGRLMQEQPPGSMLAVSRSVEAVEEFLDAAGEGELALAAVNGPELCTVSGPSEAVAALAERLEAEGVRHQRLHTSHAFHSPMMEGAVAPFVEAVGRVALAPLKRPCLSNVSGDWLRPEEATDPTYWGRQLRHTVRFAQGLEVLLRTPDQVYLEVGPGRTLTTLVREQPMPEAPEGSDRRRVTAVATLRHPQDPTADGAVALEALGRLWLAGVEVDWQGFYRREQRHRIPLPTYPFQRRRYWVERRPLHPGPPPAVTAEPFEERPGRESAVGDAEVALPERPDLETPYLAPRDEDEALVAEVWGDLLGVERVGARDNFFELGGHSLLATQVVVALRHRTGLELPLRDLFARPTVAGVARALATVREEEPEADATELPVLEPDLENRHRPFPLSEVQQAYWVGRGADFALGNVGTHVYLEIDTRGLDLDRLTTALRGLIDHHDMLRATVLPDGRQQILPEVPAYEIRRLDLRDRTESERREALEEVRGAMSHQVLESDQWPLFEVRASRVTAERTRLHISFDFLIGDAWSWQLLLRQLQAAYLSGNSPGPPQAISFREYILAEVALQESPLHARSLRYWLDQLDRLPGAPELPWQHLPEGEGAAGFVRRQGELEPELWQRLKRRAARAQLTPSGILVAAFAEALALWSKSPRFTLNLTLFNRLPLHPQVNGLVGDFTSVILLEVDNRGHDGFARRARQTQNRLWEALDHRYVSGVRVLREMARRSPDGLPPSMPVVFTSTLSLDQDAPEEGIGGIGGTPGQEVLGEVVYSISQTPQVLLDHQVGEAYGALVYNWDALEAAYPPGLLDDLFAAYGELLRRLAEEEEPWQDPAPLAPPPAHLAVQQAANDTAADLSPDRSSDLPDLFDVAFARRAHEATERIAVIDTERQVSYGELAAAAERLARILLARGAGRGRLVGVCLRPGWRQIVAVLGVVQAGAAYLPLDPDLPSRRRDELLHQGELEILLVDPDGAAESEPLPEGVARLPVDGRADPDDSAGKAALPDPGERGPVDLAYVLFTSGSTGVPKGVMMDHRAVVNTLRDIEQRFAVGEGDAVLGLSSLSFDLSVFDIFGVLGAGGTLVLPDPERRREPGHWLELIRRHGISVWNSVPALLQMLLDYLGPEPGPQAAVRPESLRLVLLSGDWIPVDLPARLRAQAPEARVISLGGATEGAIWSIHYPIEEVDPAWSSIPYGKSLANQTMHVLDHRLRPRPLWVPGDLYIGGRGLAQGYWRAPVKTADAFVVDPETGGRLYRTGDLGRWLPQGDIEFLGREDGQVKIRGYRVELGEVEASLTAHPGIQRAVAAVVGDPRGDRRLVAYVVPADGEEPAAPELAAHVEARLPSYMVPSAFVSLQRIPLTANGKVDRKALPPPPVPGEADAAQDVGGGALGSPLEEMVAEIWAGAFDLERVGRVVDFYELGGHSLLATRIIARLREACGVELPVRALFEDPTVARLARRVERQMAGERQGAPPLERLDPSERDGDRVTLSFAQQRLWFLDQLEPGSAAYNIPAVVRLDGPLHVAALEDALVGAVDRHEVLRTAIHSSEGSPYGLVSAVDLSLPVADLGGLKEVAAEAEAVRLAEAELRRPLDLAQAPLVRACLLRQRPEAHTVLLTLHHIAGDAWSMGLLLEELAAPYAAAVEGKPFEAEPPEIQYADFAHWQRRWLQGEVLEEQLDYWRRRLGGEPSPELRLPMDHPPEGSSEGMREGDRRGAQRAFTLEAELVQGVRRLGREHGVTLFMTLLAAFEAFLHRTAGQSRITVGADIANRTYRETETMIGFFVNMLVLRVEVEGSLSFEDLLGRVRKVALGAYAHQDVPFEKLVEVLQPERSGGHSPLFQVVFNFNQLVGWGRDRGRPQFPGLELNVVDPEEPVVRFDLSLTITAYDEGVEGIWLYDRDRFEASTVDRFHRHYVTLLEGAVADPQQAIDDLPMLSEEEQQQRRRREQRRQESRRARLLMTRARPVRKG